jgi:hypothetical protein
MKSKKSFSNVITFTALAFGLIFSGCDTGTSYSSDDDDYTPYVPPTSYEYYFENYSSHPVSINVSGYGSFTLGATSDWQKYVELTTSSIYFTYSPTSSVYYEHDGRNYSFYNKSDSGGSTTAPSAPTITSATALSSSGVSVSWTPVSGATQYLVYYGTGSQLTTYITAYSSPATVSGLSANTAYKFIVKAGNSAGWSADSNVMTANTSASSGGSGVGSVRVVNSSSYSNDPIYAELYKQADNTLLGSIYLAENQEYTFTNVPTGILLQVGALDNYDYVYWCTAFTLTSGQTKIITYNGDRLSP